MSSPIAAAPADIDFAFDTQALGDSLLGKLDALRDADPIFWSDQNQAWVVTGYDEVAEGYMGTLPLSSVRLPNMAVAQVPPAERERLYPNVMHAPKAWLLNMDEPGHSRLRRLVVKAFSKPVVEGIRPDVRRYIDETLDEVAQIDGPFDFVSRVARVIPARMILKQLGLDDRLVAKLHHWSNVMNSFGGINVPAEMLAEMDAVLQQMRDLFYPEYEKRRANPTGDFLSALVTANEGGDTLSVDEMFGICVIVLIAGHDITANTMALGVGELAKDPAAGRRLAEAPDTLNAIMELQRRVGMSTLMSRIVAEDFDWRGHALKAGQFVLLCQLGANRDPKVFPEPDRFDFERPQFQNMTFAPGMHHCIGHLLAKMVLTEFFPAFFRRFDVERMDPALDFNTILAFRGLDSLTIKLTERKETTQ